MAMLLGGIFNYADPFFNLPLYVWLWALTLVVAGVVWVIGWAAIWKPLEALHGLFEAKKAKQNATIVFDSHNQGLMDVEYRTACIFNVEDENDIHIPGKLRLLPEIYPEEQLDAWLRHYKKSPNRSVAFVERLEGPLERSANVRCNNTRVSILIDSDNWTVPGSPQNLAIKKSAKEWNAAHPDDLVLSFQKYSNYLMDGKIPCPACVTFIENIPWSRIDQQFTPGGLSNSAVGGLKRILSNIMLAKRDENVMMIAKLILVAGIGLAALALILRFVGKLL